jgi:hypothetical protein
MTTQRTAGSKGTARRDRAALERWARRQLILAQRATAHAVQEHLAAGRTVVFERDGRLYAKTGARGKATLLEGENAPIDHRNPGFAETPAPKYISRAKKKVRRAKSR